MKFLIILLILVIGCSGKSINVDKGSKYIVVSTNECNLEIPIRYQKIEKHHYNYVGLQGKEVGSFINIEEDLNKNYHQYLLNQIEEISTMQLISIEKTKHLTIIKFSFEGDENNYYIIGKKSLIQLLNIPEDDAKYIINTCDNTIH